MIERRGSLDDSHLLVLEQGMESKCVAPTIVGDSEERHHQGVAQRAERDDVKDHRLLEGRLKGMKARARNARVRRHEPATLPFGQEHGLVGGDWQVSRDPVVAIAHFEDPDRGVLRRAESTRHRHVARSSAAKAPLEEP